MCIEVVHYKDNLFGIRIHDVCKVFDFLRPVKGCTMLPYAYMMRPSKQFYKSKYTDSSVAYIFGISFPVTSSNHWQRFPCLTKKLVWILVHTYNRAVFIIGKFINIKDILHAGYEFRVFLCRDAPVVVFVRS